ncbi:hypothetical protein AYO44_17215 [Planctomycetaceae bacterium SCGC AG-212-F19]|nr:hypothetical protein AYO44_17215 [Planctomycetaceae bacterium SCGC AG-212-F19]
MFTGCKGFRRMGRRQFFRVGGAGLFGLTMAQLFEAQARAAEKATAKQMVVIWLGGGPPHQDTFDLKPDAPAEVRGEFKPIATNVPGIEITELMPRLAKVADKFSIIRSCRIGNETWEHSGGAYWLTGNPRRPSTPKYPMYGSVVAKLKPAQAALPSFVALGTIRNHSGDIDHNYLGPAYDPLTFDPEKPGDQVRNMLAPAQLDVSALGKDEELRKALDGQLRQLDGKDATIAGLDQFQQKAFDLLRSPKLREALDLAKEDPKTAARYGKVNLNQGGTVKILAARRLIEAGVPFVYVPFGYWDLHGENFKGCRQMVPPLDMAVASLLEDLDERGLLKTTIVVLLGEMGRTPKINKSSGRDHWGTCQSVLVAGGGFKGGTVVGGTDKIAAYATEKPYKVESFGRTIYHLLGIDPSQELYTTSNRPLKIILEEAPLIQEALA